MNDLKTALGLQKNDSPFPWQEDLLNRFLEGIPSCMSLDIPTGLGKTSVMAIWMIAKSKGAALPRRLVYVVDRRAVVDQSTTEAERLRAWIDENPTIKSKLGFENGQSLPISTLRGQHIDNRTWQEDPSLPAIIVGTVDMVGSRFLFEGYGVSRKMRPYQAGLLGADTLFVLDEAHLVPPFEKLLQTIVLNSNDFGPLDKFAHLVPVSKLLSLSATGRSAEGETIRLSERDMKHVIAEKRLKAEKKLSFCLLDGSKSLPEQLAEKAWELTQKGLSHGRIIIFCNSRDDAEKSLNAIIQQAKGNRKEGIETVDIETQLFVGARRVREREMAADWLDTHGFLAGNSKKADHACFVFATSAGEVGVDLDADHMVCDLVAWERMVQRLGRVNRRGRGHATVCVVIGDFSAEKKEPEIFKRPICALPEHNGCYDASPGAIRNLKVRSEKNEELAGIIKAATSENPLRPALTRPIIEAWSMTSLEKHTGRPLVAPWLRGWIDEKHQTTVIWRRFLPICRGIQPDKTIQKSDVKEFFESAPPHLSEFLETESYRVLDWLVKQAKTLLKGINNENKTNPPSEIQFKEGLKSDSVVGIVLGHAFDVLAILKLRDLIFEGHDKKENKRRKSRLEHHLNNNTLVLDCRFGGLSQNGLLESGSKTIPCTADGGTEWLVGKNADISIHVPIPAFRIRESEDGISTTDSGWQTCFRFVTQVSEEGEPIKFLIVDKWKHLAASEDARSVSKSSQELQIHLNWAEQEAKRLSSRLGFPDDYAKMLQIAARLHDAGKNCDRWQNAFSAKKDGRPYAKTTGPVRFGLLDGYRHEFGSLPFVEADPQFQELTPDLQDLCLHLVAAHHGFARPVIRIDGCEDGPPSVLEGRARDVALRFARLQKQWGPWGLAWWESLLRAADQQASRFLETQKREVPNG
jgi:CRISPR-associated endonuclease/helicase Cas3